MGIDALTAQFLFASKSAGVNFSRTLMLGRQDLVGSPREFSRRLRGFPRTPKPEVLEALFFEKDGFADALFRYLGADLVVSLDASSFEGATLTHDLNEPLPEDLRERFTCVFDGGTLEHVFDFPQALKNAMKMVAVGGHLLAISPTNNYTGHGFYQFSPEVFFRACSRENGFEMEDMLLRETGRDAWYRVRDPAVLGRESILTNRRRAELCYRARRVEAVEPFLVKPQQGEYILKWDDREPEALPASTAWTGIKRRLYQRAPRALRVTYDAAVGRLRRFDSEGFERTRLGP